MDKIPAGTKVLVKDEWDREHQITVEVHSPDYDSVMASMPGLIDPITVRHFSRAFVKVVS